jgi:MFS family permease
MAAAALVLLSMSHDFSSILRVALVFGAAQAMTMGASQTFAMDLAPENRRGSFLGVWTVFQSAGAFVGPLAAGAIVATWGFTPAFVAAALWLAASGLLMAVFGPETGSRRKVQQ